MKVVIVLATEIEKSPYLKYYTDVFDSINVKYEIICWNKYSSSNSNSHKTSKVFNYDLKSSETSRFYKKVIDYYKYSRFVIKILKSNEYDIITVHTIINALFLKSYLKKKFPNKYIIDIRDYSPVVPLFRKSIKRIILNSAFTTISSVGFKSWLPPKIEYVLGHNTIRNAVSPSQEINEVKYKTTNNFTILTIGQIRNFETSIRIINDFGNKRNFILKFTGKSIIGEELEQYSLNCNYKNVIFEGSYQKENECEIVKAADFLYIVLPTTILESCLISNRFYLSLIYRKPMIVNEESIQAEYVRKYNLGLIVNSKDNIYDKLNDYILNFDFSILDKGCNDLLQLIKLDIDIFENKIKELCLNN